MTLGCGEPVGEDYESLPTHSLYVHLVAGAGAGMMEHCVMYPIDSVKTRMQSLCPCPEKACRTPMHGLIEMIRTEGILRPMKGVSSIAMGAAPAHALYYTVYEKSKLYLTGGHSSHSQTLAYGLSGILATFAHDAVMNPAEVIKQRMQMCNSPFKNTLECMRCVYQVEGIHAFYRSYLTQLLLNVPFQSVHFMTYEFCQQLLNPHRQYDPKSHLISGALAGGLAAAVTCPLDVIKTVLNTQQKPTMIVHATRSIEMALASNSGTIPSTSTPPTIVPQDQLHCKTSYHGIRDAARGIYASRGAIGFFSGFQARILVQMPSTAISWSVYELFKFLLSRTDTH